MPHHYCSEYSVHSCLCQSSAQARILPRYRPRRVGFGLSPTDITPPVSPSGCTSLLQRYCGLLRELSLGLLGTDGGLLGRRRLVKGGIRGLGRLLGCRLMVSWSGFHRGGGFDILGGDEGDNRPRLKRWRWFHAVRSQLVTQLPRYAS